MRYVVIDECLPSLQKVGLDILTQGFGEQEEHEHYHARNSENTDGSGVHGSGHLYLNVQNKNENEIKNATGEDTLGPTRGGSLRRSRRLIACIFVFVLNV